MVGQNAEVRAFIAIHISMVASRALADVIERLRTAIPRGVRWVDPEGVHLTLKFLGNIDPGLTDQVLVGVQRSGQCSTPFQLHLAGLGMFPNDRRPRVLWAGVSGDLDALGELNERVEAAMSDLGFPKERRPFSPHLTIGRVREGFSSGQGPGIAEYVSAALIEPTEPWWVESLHLVRSNLTPRGADYTSLGSVALIR